MKRFRQSGFSHIIIIVVMIIILGLLGFVAFQAFSKRDSTMNGSRQNQTTQAQQSSRITWNYSGTEWSPSSTPPKCSTPILTTSPVDMETVTAILYPGQVRGQYKAHGGFHFRNNTTNDVIVKMPIDGYITSAVRYYQTGDNGVDELQYLVTFLNDCGISIKFDHLLTLSPEVQAIMDKQPEPKLNDTGSLPITGGALFKEGSVIATAVGQASNVSVGMDFGVYDYRQKNRASQNPTYAAEHKQAAYQDYYALCWLNDLPIKDSQRALSLPAGDGKMGKTSDYCP